MCTFKRKKKSRFIVFQIKYFELKKRSKRNYTLTTIVFESLGEGVGQNVHAKNFETLLSFIIYIDSFLREIACEKHNKN